MPPRQYLIIPASGSPKPLLDAVEKKIAGNDVAAILIEGESKQELSVKIDQIRACAHKNDIAILLKDQFDLVKDLGFDGVHIEGDEKRVKEARKLLGPSLIVGSEAKTSRHNAMLLGEAGADYIAFSGKNNIIIEELCNWWAPIFKVPCVAFFEHLPENINNNSTIEFYSITLSA